MREFHERDAREDIGVKTDSGVDAPERHVGDSRRPDRAIVQDAENRIDLALAYHERVAIEYAACGQENAAPTGKEGVVPLAPQIAKGVPPGLRSAVRIRGMSPVLEIKLSVRMEREGRAVTPPFSRAHEISPMPGTCCRT